MIKGKTLKIHERRNQGGYIGIHYTHYTYIHIERAVCMSSIILYYIINNYIFIYLLYMQNRKIL